MSLEAQSVRANSAALPSSRSADQLFQLQLSHNYSINSRQLIAYVKYTLQTWQGKAGGQHAGLQEAVEWLDNMPRQVRLVLGSIMAAAVAWQNNTRFV